MSNTTRPWRFYGREKSKKNLKQSLGFFREPDKRTFSAIRVSGRRRVGKTRLIEEVLKEDPASWPFIYYEVPDKEGMDFEDYTLDKVIVDLQKLAERAGFPDIMDQLPLPLDHPHYTDWSKCEDFLFELMQKNVVLVLDEFHLSVHLELNIPVKKAIDRILKNFDIRFPGKIILTGSHQQKFDRMFERDASFHGRVSSGVHLEQWSLRTIMDMASEQGLLARPNQFLTLWTAYGGMPSHWQRYCTADKYSHLHKIEDMDEWRQAFLDIERDNLVTVKGERFDDRAFVELQPIHRDILLWIAENHPNKGLRAADVARGFEFGNEDIIYKNLDFLRDRLKLMDTIWPIDKVDKCKWLITDNNTVFQLNVFREIFKTRKHTRKPGFGLRDPDKPDQSTDTPLDRLKTLEGHALERITAEYFETLAGMQWVRPSVEHGGFRGDMDIMAIRWEDNENVLYLAEAKRNTRSFRSITDIRKYQDAFLNSLSKEADNAEELDKLRHLNCRRFLVAPHFTDQKRLDIEKDGTFEILDIPKMARGLGFDPAPMIKPESPPEPKMEDEHTPEPPKSSSLRP